MASGGHSGQIRNSSSPSVLTLGSNKSSSVTTAKPRFRSRTGCWTCRRRKVKCDERGRNPETVAYGGPLSTSAGCKRCEDSGRPCHGYGAQAPSAPILTQYPVTNLSGESLIGPNSFYSFPRHPRDSQNFAQPHDFHSYLGGIEAPPSNLQWNQAYMQPQPITAGGSNAQPFSRQGSCSAVSSSAPTVSSGAVSNSPQQTTILLPSVDLRRYSAPNCPSWKNESQSRNHGSGSQRTVIQQSFPFSGQNSPDFEEFSSSKFSRAAGSVTNHPQDFEPREPSFEVLKESESEGISYSQASSAGSKPPFQFDFNRPHTSSGVLPTYSSQSYHNNTSKPHPSPAPNSFGKLSCIGESSYTSPTISPDTPAPHFLDEHNLWQDSQVISEFPRTSTTFDQSFRPQPVVIPSFLSSTVPGEITGNIVSGKKLTRCNGNFDPLSARDASDYSRTHEIPSGLYILKPDTSSTEEKSSNAQFSEPLKSELYPTNCESLNSRDNFRNNDLSSRAAETCAKAVGSSLVNPFDVNLASYAPSYSEPAQQPSSYKSTERKDSSCSTLSSQSTQDHGTSPLASGIRPSVNQPYSKNPSLSCSPKNSQCQFSPNSAAQIPPLIGTFAQPLATHNCHSQPRSLEKWTSSFLGHQQADYHQYDFHPILHQAESENKGIETFDDDSPISTSNSNFSTTVNGSHNEGSGC